MDASKAITFAEPASIYSRRVQRAARHAMGSVGCELTVCTDLDTRVVTIDLANANNVLRRPITADSAIMHPKDKILALKSQRQLQVFNIELKQKVKSHLMNEDVVFWKWINATTSASSPRPPSSTGPLPTRRPPPQKIFDRHANFAGVQFINYRATTDEKLLVLLYSNERGVSQPIEAHAAAFVEIKLDGHPHPTMCAAMGAKLHIVEIHHAAGNPVFQKKAVVVFLPTEATNDLPVAMQVSQQHGIIYLVTKYGFIYLNNNPEAFLKENNLYEPLVVGKYCEKRDLYLAFIAYAKGMCDDELVAITNENAMFKQQAQYLLMDQIIATSIPECTDPDDVSIIVEPSPFSDNKSLQNLLTLTAIRADKSKVVGYIAKLSNYDVLNVAKIATEHGLFDEALTIYKKYEHHAVAMNVLVEHIVSLDRGVEYANNVNLPELWSRLANAQLDGLRIKDSIAVESARKTGIT
ncbi:clathrin heavy-chain terminal domain-containing protein [Exidia glandulosa HHB12029]|uniref:Clathrin heavy-chain terminal domain-containing protein n=1 Tax=Exidia glandulosa HHB12029 TaxID=1314781 RepID=A0A165IKL9_EXIGL|nr:clathrin heavy-chain terminal domain-containing protein [Exidia glandulosa HHB12029]